MNVDRVVALGEFLARIDDLLEVAVEEIGEARCWLEVRARAGA